MLIATFGPTTGWAGKTIQYENGQFALDGHGPLSAQDVIEYDRQGHLVWAGDGMRAWVASLVTASPKHPQKRSRLGLIIALGAMAVVVVVAAVLYVSVSQKNHVKTARFTTNVQKADDVFRLFNESTQSSLAGLTSEATAKADKAHSELDTISDTENSPEVGNAKLMNDYWAYILDLTVYGEYISHPALGGTSLAESKQLCADAQALVHADLDALK
jgi:hypothetical protein